MARVVTLTVNPTIDIDLELDHLRDSGKNRARVRTVEAGGGGINVARGIGLLGGQVIAVHTAGREVGRRLNRLLDEEGLDHRGVAVDAETREAIVLFETGSDRSYHIVPPGSHLCDNDVRRCLDELLDEVCHGEYVVLSGSLPPGVSDDFYAEAAREVEDRGARVVLDASGVPLRAALQAGVFLAKPNRREAAEIVGQAVDDFDDARTVNEHLLSTGAVQVALTTVGSLGTMCSTAEGHTEVHTPSLPDEIRSDAGAGDSLVAALTHRLSEGDDPVDACAMGVAAAAASLLTPGSDLFQPSDVESLRRDVRIFPGVPG